MTFSPPSNFEKLTTDEKCNYLFAVLQDISSEPRKHKNGSKLGRLERLELRLNILQDVVAESYPSIEELQRLLAVPHKTWAIITANSRDFYRANFAYWLYQKSKDKWRGTKMFTARQVAFGLNILEDYERKNGPIPCHTGIFAIIKKIFMAVK